MLGRISLLSVATVFLASGFAHYSAALPIAPLNAAQVGGVSNVIEVAAQKSNKGKPQAKAKAKAPAKAKVAKKAVVKKNVVKKTVVQKNVVVRRTVIVNRPYRAWVHRPYYGLLIGGVALGTVIAVSSPHVVPIAPGPNACWYWADPAEINGYWDYCNPI